MENKRDELRVCLVGPITGYPFEVVAKWRKEFCANPPQGMVGIDPLRKRSELATSAVVAGEYPKHRLASKKGILAQNKFDVMRSSAILANFLGADRLSLGSVIELALAFQAWKRIVVVMEKENPHDHPYVRSCADVVVETMDEACAELCRPLNAGLKRSRDWNMQGICEGVGREDVVFIDLSAEPGVPIHKIAKLAWANALAKPIVVAIPEGLPERDLRCHPLIRACAQYVVADRALAETLIADLRAYS